MKPPSQKQVWQKIAPKWHEFRKETQPEVIEFLKGKKGKILDLGCGNARNMIAKKGIKYYGIDFSSEMLEFAKEKVKKEKINAELVQSDISKLPYEDDFFDFAIFIRVLHGIEKIRHRKILKELHRVLKSGGHALIGCWSKEQDRMKNKKPGKGHLVPWTINGEKVYRYVYIYELKELERVLKEIGFKIKKSWVKKNNWVVVEK